MGTLNDYWYAEGEECPSRYKSTPMAASFVNAHVLGPMPTVRLIP